MHFSFVVTMDRFAIYLYYIMYIFPLQDVFVKKWNLRKEEFLKKILYANNSY